MCCGGFFEVLLYALKATLILDWGNASSFSEDLKANLSASTVLCYVDCMPNSIFLAAFVSFKIWPTVKNVWLGDKKIKVCIC